MARPYSDAGENVMLNALGALAVKASVHTAYPGNTGASEVVGGGYTKETIAWAAAAAGSMAASVLPTFDMPGGGTDAAWIGYWNLAETVFYGSSPSNAGIPVPFTAEDTTDVFTADNHGLVDGTRVVLFDTSGAVLPTGVTEGDPYYVRDATTDTLKLALTVGGVAINLTADGAGFIVSTIVQTFALPGSFLVTSAILDLLR